MFSTLRLKLAIYKNRLLRFRGPALRDQCAKLIMHTCSLQLERSEVRELAPTLGAAGPMLLSGGAITTVTYSVFDPEADKVDPAIKNEPWRAFSKVIMRLSIEKDPEFEVKLLKRSPKELPDPTKVLVVDEWVEIEPRTCHKAPGLALVKHLSQYFPLIPRPHQGPTIAPGVTS